MTEQQYLAHVFEFWLIVPALKTFPSFLVLAKKGRDSVLRQGNYS